MKRVSPCIMICLICLIHSISGCFGGGGVTPDSDTTSPTWGSTAGITGIVAQNDSATIHWGTADDLLSPPVVYLLYMDIDNDPFDQPPVERSTNDPYTFTGLQDGQTYWFAVRCRDSATESNFDDNTNIVSTDDIPSDPQLVNTLDYLNFESRSVAVSGIYAYVTDFEEGGLMVFDVSDPSNPVLTGFLDTNGQTGGVSILGSILYIADGDAGFLSVDVSDPSNPVVLGFFAAGAFAYDVAADGGYVYVMSTDGLLIFEASDPASLSLICSESISVAYDIKIVGNYAYIAGGFGFRVIDVSVPETPVITSTYSTGGDAYGLSISGNIAYVAHENGLTVVDISDPSSLLTIGMLSTIEAWGVAVAGDYAYVADKHDSLLVVDISTPSLPQVVNSVDSDQAFYVCVEGDYAYVAARKTGVRIYNISDMLNPVSASVIDSFYPQCVTVSGIHAYIGGMEGNLKIFDLSDASIPVEIATIYVTDPVNQIVVESNHAFIVGGNVLRVLDISNVNMPVFLGSIDIGEVANGVAISGNYAYVTTGSALTLEHSSGILKVIDICNPGLPAAINEIEMPWGSNYWPNAYIDNIKISDGYAYLIDYEYVYKYPAYGQVIPYTAELQVFSLDDPVTPEVIGSNSVYCRVGDIALFDDVIFVAETWQSALHIIDVSDPASPTDAGQLDMLMHSAEISFGYLYAGRDDSFDVLDISDPINPVVLSSLQTDSKIKEIAIAGNYACLINDSYSILVSQLW